MNSFDIYFEQIKKNLSPSIDSYPLSHKRIIKLNSARDNNSNNISSSRINYQSILFPKRSPSIKHNKYSYKGRAIKEDLDISKTILDYDIQITTLKKKLSIVKEQRKQSEKKVNIKKFKINKLLNDEKISIKELQNIKKNIQKIMSNREKNKNNSIKINYGMKNKNKSHTIIKKYYIKSKNNTLNNSSLKDKNYLEKHKSFQVSMKKPDNLSNNIQMNSGIITPKTKNLINEKRPNNTSCNRGISSNEIYGTYSFRNSVINEEKINSNNNFKKKNHNDNSDNHKILKNITNLNMKKNIRNKNNLKNQIKKNLINKLKKHEDERRRIQDEIKQIEKEQYDLWINFSENMSSGNTTSNTNVNNTHKKIIKSDLYDKDEEDDIIVNYKYM